MDDATKQVISTLESQLSQRLEKLWNVFSWCSSILITITAGVLAVAASKDFDLTFLGLVLISVVISILTIYARKWLSENLDFETEIRGKLDELYIKELKQNLYISRPVKAKFGYIAMITWLGIIAFLATWGDYVFDIIDKSK
jgi:hypothetical protein